MSLLFHFRGKKLRVGCWWLGLLLAAALSFPGCKHLGAQDDVAQGDGLRRSDLALPARQARAKEGGPAKKSADDAWMSDEAQSVYHDLD